MNRRHFVRHVLQYAGVGFGAGLGLELLSRWPLAAQELAPVDPVAPVPESVGLTLTWLQHSCVLFADPSLRVLVNPFRAVGCTAGHTEPVVSSDLVLISSRLFDEGYLEIVPGNPRALFEAGDYQVDGIRFQGVRMAHDALTSAGNRFGTNVGWRWRQAGIDVVHLGGAAAPITREQEILLARPDVLLIPVGGGPKNYDAQGARAAIEVLQPKLVIPTMYRTEAAAESCELQSIDAFLSLYGGAVQQVPGDTLVLTPQGLPSTGLAVVTFAS